MSDVLSFGELIPDLWSSQDFRSRTVILMINPGGDFYDDDNEDDSNNDPTCNNKLLSKSTVLRRLF